MAWNKLKSMFVVSDEPQAQAASDPDQVIADLDKYQLPEGETAPLPEGTSAAALSGQIDFQALYDQAGIPNTDEVEAVERFLNGLDASLPDASKLAASKAFLSAIGKSVGELGMVGSASWPNLFCPQHAIAPVSSSVHPSEWPSVRACAPPVPGTIVGGETVQSGIV